MNRWKILVPALSLAVVFLAGCQKQEFPEVTPADPVFKMTGTIDGEPFEHNVGLDGTYLHTDLDFWEEDHGWMESWLTYTDCEDCDTYASLELYTGLNHTYLDVLEGSAQVGVGGEPLLASYYFDGEELFEHEGIQVTFDGNVIEEPWQLITLDPDFPWGQGTYEVVYPVDEGAGGFAAWSIDQIPVWDECALDDVLYPGIEATFEENSASFSFSEDFEYESVFVYNEMTPEVWYVFNGGDEIILDEWQFFPTQTITFEFFSNNGNMISAHFATVLFETDTEVEIPDAYIVPDLVVEEPLFALTMNIDGELYGSFDYCFGGLYEQSPTSYFEITSSEAYEQDAAGNSTQKVEFSCKLDLYPLYTWGLPAREVHITDGVIAFAVPD